MGAGGRKDYDLSARDFKMPLLAALGSITNNTADKPVRYKDTWSPICADMGITLDQYGYAENNKTKVQCWISWAFQHLKKEDQVIGVGRGKWALTESGVETLKGLGLKPVVSTPAAMVAAKDEDTAPSEPELPPTVGVTHNIGPGNADEGYHPDPYIRALATQSTKCYGCYTPRSTVCERCPLSGACQNLVAAELSTLAATLAAEDAKAAEAAAKAAMPQATPAPQAKPAVQEEDKPKAKLDTRNADALVAHVESTCCRCGETITVGSNCYWIRNTGDQKGGMLHEHCL